MRRETSFESKPFAVIKEEDLPLLYIASATSMVVCEIDVNPDDLPSPDEDGIGGYAPLVGSNSYYLAYATSSGAAVTLALELIGGTWTMSWTYTPSNPASGSPAEYTGTLTRNDPLYPGENDPSVLEGQYYAVDTGDSTGYDAFGYAQLRTISS